MSVTKINFGPKGFYDLFKLRFMRTSQTKRVGGECVLSEIVLEVAETFAKRAVYSLFWIFIAHIHVSICAAFIDTLIKSNSEPSVAHCTLSKRVLETSNVFVTSQMELKNFVVTQSIFD